MTPIDFAPSMGPVPMSAWGDLRLTPEEILMAARRHGLMPCNAAGEWIPFDYVVDEGVAGVFLDVPPSTTVWSAADAGSGEGDYFWMDGESLADGHYRLFSVKPRPEGDAGIGWKGSHNDTVFTPCELIEQEKVQDWWTLMERLTSMDCPFVGFHQDGMVYRVYCWLN